MKTKIKMRVDFLDNGQIIPLMFVNENEETLRIDRIIESNRIDKSTFRFICRCSDKIITVFLEDYMWYVLSN